MAGCGASTSGRAEAPQAPWPAPFRAPGGGRASSRARQPGRQQRLVGCQAVALPGGRLQAPLLKALGQIFLRPPQEPRVEALVVDVGAGDPEDEHGQRERSLSSLLRQATFAAINVGLRMTGIALRLARNVVLEARRGVRFLQVQQAVQAQATAARAALDAETLAAFQAQRARLRLRGQDAGFMRMLRCLDRSHIDHEAKWALVQKHTADKADLSDALQQLFKAAGECKEAVETQLRPDASCSERNAFWRSPQTAALIAEEESLKRLVFAQMLQAS